MNKCNKCGVKGDKYAPLSISTKTDKGGKLTNKSRRQVQNFTDKCDKCIINDYIFDAFE